VATLQAVVISQRRSPRPWEITAAPLDGARSVSEVLNGLAGKRPPPARRNSTTWAERTGHTTPDFRVVDTELDRRHAELGEQLATEAPGGPSRHGVSRPPSKARSSRTGGSAPPSSSPTAS
jgi:hypothetical protein